MYALNPLQMQSKTTSTRFKLESCMKLPFITSASVTPHMHSPLANIVLQIQYLKHLLSFDCRLGRQQWSCLHGNLNRPCRIRLSVPWKVFQLQHKRDAIFTSCMNDGTSRRTTLPVITRKCCLPLQREECHLLHQKNNTACSTTLFLSILPPKNWPSLNLHYLTEVSRMTACGSLPAYQAPVTSSKRPTAARDCSDYYNWLALKWLWNLTASEWDTDIITQQQDVNWNRQTRHAKAVQQSAVIHSVTPLFLHLCKSQPDAVAFCKVTSQDENKPTASVSKSAWLVTGFDPTLKI